MDQATLNRFWSKINQDGPLPAGHPELGPCWPWRGAPSSDGYGTFSYQRKELKAHRLAYELLVRPIPDGLTIDHLCHNDDPGCGGGPSCLHRLCVAPGHLDPVPRDINTRRSRHTRASINAARDECPAGHKYEGDNVRITASGGRQCRRCDGWTGAVPPQDRMHCPQKHGYTPGNTIVNKLGQRSCRTCANAQNRERRQRKRAADNARKAGASEAEAPGIMRKKPGAEAA